MTEAAHTSRAAADNFGFVSAFQLWICTAAMLLGRLELITVLVLFTGRCWRK